MKELIQQLSEKCAGQIDKIEPRGTAEIAIILKNNVDAATFSQELQNHVVELIDSQTIIKIDVLDANQKLIDSFATNQ